MVSLTVWKYLVRRNARNQHHPAVIAEAAALTLDGNTSPITAHGSGPNPEKLKKNVSFRN